MKLTDEQIAAIRDRCENIQMRNTLDELLESRAALAAALVTVNEQADEIERLRRERDEARARGKAGAYKATPEHSWAEWCADRQAELDAATARVAELEGGLGFYADASNFEPRHITHECGCCSSVEDAIAVQDGGRRARIALGRDA